jgi:hypothetical protein
MTASIDVLLFELKKIFRCYSLSGQTPVRQRWKLAAQSARQFGVDIGGDDAIAFRLLSQYLAPGIADQ